MKEENILLFFDELINNQEELEVLHLFNQGFEEEEILKTIIQKEGEGDKHD